MQTRTLYSIMFFKDVISDLTRYCRNWFPLVNLQSCEVIGDFPYGHIMLYVYATKSDNHECNLRYKETDSSMINSFSINDMSRKMTKNVLLPVMFFLRE